MRLGKWLLLVLCGLTYVNIGVGFFHVVVPSGDAWLAVAHWTFAIVNYWSYKWLAPKIGGVS